MNVGKSKIRDLLDDVAATIDVGGSKLKVLIAAAILVAFILIIVVVIILSDVLSGSESSEERNIAYLILTIAGVVVLFMTLKHVDVKKK